MSTQRITFSARDYVEGLQALMDARDVGVVVRGFSPEKLYEKLASGPAAELVIERYECASAGADWRGLDGVFEGALIVMQRADKSVSETATFELALEVAIALDRDAEYEGPPLPYGPLTVTCVEPEPLDEALEQRVVAYRVAFYQHIVVRALELAPNPPPLEGLYAGRVPIESIDDYKKLVPR